jgi:hypothetical protein
LYAYAVPVCQIPRHPIPGRSAALLLKTVILVAAKTVTPDPEFPTTVIQNVCDRLLPLMRDIVGALKFHCAFQASRLFQAEREMGELTADAATESVTNATESEGYCAEKIDKVKEEYPLKSRGLSKENAPKRTWRGIPSANSGGFLVEVSIRN